ncbi:glycosyltransferase [Jannaschia seosinensis]|uniref:glycosyltransferase n=1 Tax=Jannaschia seosinensis TaxID=313367 RepID=UPI001640E24D|nr:glycosyltransferase [Jannaschia seosinensis]
MACGNPDRAEQWIAAAARRDMVAAADLALSRVAVAAGRGASDAELSGILGSLYADAGLAAVSLAGSGSTRFDRLSAVPGAAAKGPLVSVIVPVHNAAATLPQALAGLLAQDWISLEILAVDDASTDESVAIAEATGDARIRVLRQPHNEGAYTARNAGLAAARGEMITVHDADDWSHPSKIRLQVEALLSDPAAMASVSHWARVDDALYPALWRIEAGWTHRNVSSLMIRASLRETLGFWDRVRVNADTEHYYRILAAFGPRAITEVRPGLPLAFGRTSPTSLTMRAETHISTQFRGARRDYLDAARVWHGIGGSLFLPEHPDHRSFEAPQALGPKEPPGALSDFEVLRASTLFDQGWYLEANEDVLMADTPPAQHYLENSGVEGRDPGPRFSSSAYAHVHGLDPETPPLLHYLRAGGEHGSGLFNFSGTGGGSGDRVLVFAHAAGQAVFGAERSFLDMLNRIAREGAAPVAVLPSLGSAAYLDAIRAKAAHVEILPQLWRRLGRNPHAVSVAECRALIRRHEARVVHVNTLVLDAPLAAARAEGVETVVHVRELLAEDPALCRILGGTAEEVRTTVLAEADRFVANSPLVHGWLGVPERTKIRLNMVDDALFSVPFLPRRELRVALVSSNIAKKGLGDVIAVAHRVGEVSERVRFVLVGPESADLKALGPLPENVTLAGYAASPMDAMAQADVVLSVSQFAESFGRTVLEAMAAGRPVICYDRGTPPWLVGRGEEAGGIVVSPDRPHSVARAVLALEAARIGLDRLSKRARVRARELQQAGGGSETTGA